MVRIYEVWEEGFLIQGMDKPGQAHLIGKCEANSFRDACVKLCKNNPDFSEKTLSIWGCGLFENETSARRTFG